MSIPCSQARTFALFAGLIGFGVAGFAPQIFHDGDSWWHLAAGGWMLDTHAVLKSDVFSFTFFGQPWDAHEWLSEVLMAAVYRLDGWSGEHILFGLAAGAAAAVVAGHVRGQIAALPAALVSLLGLASLSGSLLARPHLLALPLLALWTSGLLNARSEARSPRLWLAGIMLVWANLHGSFVFGLALAGAFALEAVMAARGAWKDWSIFLAACVVAAAVTPQGVNGLIFPFKLLMLGSLRNVGEWAPTSLTSPSPFLIALAGLTWLAVTRKLSLSPLRILILAGLAWLALSHVRHQMIFGIVGAMLVAEGLRRAYPDDARTLPAWLMPLGAGLLALLIAVRAPAPTVRGDDRVTPMTALERVPVALRSQPVLNAYDFGGYLIFSGVKVFVDGRTDMYGDAFLADYDRAMQPDRQALSAALEKWHIGWSILPPGPAAQMMDAMPGWHRVYGDQFAVVSVKEQVGSPGQAR